MSDATTAETSPRVAILLKSASPRRGGVERGRGWRWQIEATLGFMSVATAA
jgi:hypothetical protein